MAGTHPDPVSALTFQYAISKGIYTPKDVDPSLLATPMLIEDPPEDPTQSPAKRVKLSTESEFSLAGEPEGEQMREWLDIRNQPLDTEDPDPACVLSGVQGLLEEPEPCRRCSADVRGTGHPALAYAPPHEG